MTHRFSNVFVLSAAVSSYSINWFCNSAGDPNNHVVAGTLASIREHNLPHKIHSAKEAAKRWPMMKLAENEVGVYETNAGECGFHSQHFPWVF